MYCVTKRPVAATAATTVMTMIAEFHQSTAPLERDTYIEGLDIVEPLSPIELAVSVIILSCMRVLDHYCNLRRLIKMYKRTLDVHYVFVLQLFK